MINDIVVQPSVDAISATLWRTWFESGLKAIEQKDFTAAIKWLGEAEKHVCKCGPDDKRHVMAEAHLAYAHLLRLREWEHRIQDPCTPERDRIELLTLAEEEKLRATDTANHCLPNLTNAVASQEITLALARGAHGSGEMRKRTGDKAGAIDCFNLALRNYPQGPSYETATDEIRFSLFTLHYQCHAFQKGIEQLNVLEQHAAARNEAYRLAPYIAGRADCLVQLGRYRDARRLYERWAALAPDCAQGKSHSYTCAFAQAVFGRIHLIMGEFDAADRLISASSCWLEHEGDYHAAHSMEMPVTTKTLRFDVALLRAELALNQGDLVCARALLPIAAAMTPPWTDRKIRLCLVFGQLHLALGDFKEACKCFKEAKQLADGLLPCRLVFCVPALLGISRVDSETSDWAASIQCASQAVRLLEDADESLSAEMAAALLGLAMAYVRDDRSQAAFPLCERSHSLMQMTLRSGHPDEAVVQATLAEYYISRQTPMLAIEACRKSLALLREFAPCDGFSFARLYRIEGEAHLVDGQIQCAAHFFECALKVWQNQEEELKCKHCEMSLIMLGLATTHVALDSFGDAETTFAQLKQPLCEFKGNAARAGYELNRRANLMLACRLYAVAAWLYFHAEEYYRECYGPDHEFTRQVRQNRDEAKRRADASGQVVPMLINKVSPGKKWLTAVAKGKRNVTTY